MLDRRQFARRRTYLEGKVEVENLHGWNLTCPVRNVSDGGVRLQLPDHPVIPQVFQLAVSGQRPRAARLVWYKDGQAGISLS